MVTLRPYQILAVNQMKNGSLLKGGVGSGKSITSLAYYYVKECKGSLACIGEGGDAPMADPRPLYIITTAKKRNSKEWEKEASQFPIDVPVVIDSWNNIAKYCNVCGAFFIFDEHKAIGAGKWSKCFIQITKKNRWIILTATPGDVWMDYVPVFIANGFYKNRTQFCREHVVYDRFAKYPKIDHYENVGKLIRCKKLVTIEMEYIRPTQTHVKNIPVDFDYPTMRKVQASRWNIFNDTPIQNAAEFCATLRRVSNTSPDRIDKAKQIIAQSPRIIIFYNFDYELTILRDIASEFDRPVAEYNGHKHQDIPRAGSWIYLVQYSAGAEAWNCVETNVIMFYSLSYSYKVTIQACGRIDRMNTPYTDLYYYFLYTDSAIDRMIAKALGNKEDFNENRFYKSKIAL